ncbi:ferritin-like domain-containing protein [Russula compacta]|nr:ferritin-like domain-containing protein [Russula compacta]
MRYLPSLLAVVLVPLAVSAVPVRRDLDVETVQALQLAVTLEDLETQFYSQMLGNFSSSDFTNAGFVSGDVAIEQLQTIGSQESTHVATILGILGNTPPLSCNFDFSSVLTDVETALATARIIEDVGVGAYLLALDIIDDLDILLDAGSILTVEARHQTILNIFNNGTAIPQAFDIPLSPPEVITIAGAFVSGCDLSSIFGTQANVPLSLNNTGVITTGTSLEFESPALNSSTSGFFCQLLTGGQVSATTLPIDSCVVPPGVNGPVAVFITSDNQTLSGDFIIRQLQDVVAGPAITFVDAHTDLIDTLVRGNANTAAARRGRRTAFADSHSQGKP